MDGLAAIIGYVLVGYACYKIYKYIQLKKSQLDVVRFDQEVSDLVFKRDRAMTLHRLLTDIEICDKKNDNTKVFNISWKSELDGQIYSYDVYIGDKKASNAIALTSLANVEMNNLSPDIKIGIDRLKLRSKLLGSEFRHDGEYTSDEPLRDVEFLDEDTKVYF